eukprot:TRINITY_DN3261_c0_g1_i1.p1 TRINITY_DN3261_c0_g1~~TRINITY_DN3261_c0_g1_i1.p1  ORF type:complete len:175 (+),score=28.40 TRINITY_DN3261_c0_g1_i1:40-564(+)
MSDHDLVSLAKACGLQSPGGKLADVASEFSDVSVIGFYFSASWCPPCRSFSPVLARLCESNPDFKVVLIPGDRTDTDCQQYLAKYPFLGVPFASPAKQTMLHTMGATMMPTLHIYNAKTGGLITTWGRSVVQANADCVKDWRNGESGMAKGFTRYAGAAFLAVAILFVYFVYRK